MNPFLADRKGLSAPATRAHDRRAPHLWFLHEKIMAESLKFVNSPIDIMAESAIISSWQPIY
jgi:hypothetical protein